MRKEMRLGKVTTIPKVTNQGHCINGECGL